ncbi:hypothetical protein MLD38_017130 [Melastoma candidum]|uniref:Uncharacterized protein n=1 Tax=Melastoma candidum TaxID=119954 RepID=A0ACB9QSQ7_9MYRT|nr:hypothetical protein MLD38_017130 [Melastoma candidum]
MRASWADLAASAAADNVTSGSSARNGPVAPTAGSGRGAYVPPHLRNAPAPSDPAAPGSTGLVPGGERSSLNGPRSGGPRNDYGRPGLTGSGSRPGGWSSRGGSWGGREREVNPFGDEGDAEKAFTEQENSGINLMHMKIFLLRLAGKMSPLL